MARKKQQAGRRAAERAPAVDAQARSTAVPALAATPRTGLIVSTIVVLATFVIYSPLLSAGLTDLDTYPLIAAAKLDGLGDVLRLFGAPLMDGRMPQGDFYRPLSTLSFGIDHALWGLSAQGYHVTDLVLHLLSCAAMFGFVRALLAWAARLAPASALGPRASQWVISLATVLFAIHPVHLEIVPAIARRPEILHGLFALLSLRAFFGYLQSPTRRATIMTVMWFALAFLSKDSGVVVPGFFAIAGIIELAHRGLVQPLVNRLASLAGYTAFVGALLIIWRYKVIDGMGGYAYAKFVTHTQVLKSGAGELGRVMLLPVGDSAVPPLSLASTLLIGVVLLALAIIWRRRGNAFTASGSVPLFALGAIALQLALYVSTKTYLESRTLYLTAAFAAVLSTWALVNGLVHVLPLAPPGQRLPAGAVALIGLWLCVMNAAGGLDPRAMRTWAPAAALGERASLSLVAELRDLPAGTTVCVVNAPFSVGPPLSNIRKRYVLLDYSVQGLLDILFGAGHFQVVGVSYVSATTPDFEISTKVSVESDTLAVAPSPGAALIRFPFPRLRLPGSEPAFAPGPGPKSISLAGTACSVHKDPVFAVFDGQRFAVSVAR